MDLCNDHLQVDEGCNIDNTCETITVIVNDISPIKALFEIVLNIPLIVIIHNKIKMKLGEDEYIVCFTCGVNEQPLYVLYDAKRLNCTKTKKQQFGWMVIFLQY